MTDWVRDPDTGVVKINSDKINEIVRKLMDKIKILTKERDQVIDEYNILKNEYSKLLERTGGLHSDVGMDVDDLETDGPSTSLPDMRDLSKKDAVEDEDSSKQKAKDLSVLHSTTDHSACCSKELSMKLVEQNEILQKTIRDILQLRGYSIDDYLKFTYGRDKLMAKDREINDLKLKIKKLKGKEAADKQTSDSEHVTELSKQLADVHLQKPKELKPEDCLPDPPSKDLGKLTCSTCRKEFSNEAKAKDHERRCKDMLN